MEFIKNAWFVGISTGIISGVLVFFLTNWIMKKKGREDYFKQVVMANQNVIVALKPYIAERGLPEIEIFKSLIVSTARNYSVDVHDMYTISVFCEELIREIISDVYVSSDKKKEYTDTLITYKKEIDKENLEEKVDQIKNIIDYSERFRKRITTYMSLMVSVMTMILTIVLTFSNITDISEYYSFGDPFETNPLLWIPVMIILLIVLLMMIWQMVDFLVRKKGRKKKEDMK